MNILRMKKMKTFKDSDKILIVGGTGFIGRHLVKRCLKETSNVSILGLAEAYPDAAIKLDIEEICVDFCDKNALKKALAGKSYDYIFNLGGYIGHTPYLKGGRKVIEAHFVGLMNLLDCINIAQVKGFVQIGSSDEYGPARAPQKETMREMPISPYSLAKTAASHFIQMLSNTEGFPGVVLRLFLVYGPSQDDRRFLPQIMNACLKDDEFMISEGKQIRDFCYVGDVVDATIKAVLTPEAKGQIINIASGMPIPIKKMIKSVVELTGGGKPLWGTYPYRTGENMELYADVSLAHNLLGWKASTSLYDGLEKTIFWYKQKVKS